MRKRTLKRTNSWFWVMSRNVSKLRQQPPLVKDRPLMCTGLPCFSVWVSSGWEHKNGEHTYIGRGFTTFSLYRHTDGYQTIIGDKGSIFHLSELDDDLWVRVLKGSGFTTYNQPRNGLERSNSEEDIKADWRANDRVLGADDAVLLPRGWLMTIHFSELMYINSGHMKLRPFSGRPTPMHRSPPDEAGRWRY
jgi:hypothetical protein